MAFLTRSWVSSVLAPVSLLYTKVKAATETPVLSSRETVALRVGSGLTLEENGLSSGRWVRHAECVLSQVEM